MDDRRVEDEVPIPTLDEMGLLPPGVHVCQLEEIEERFARFQTSDRRIHLFAKLKSYFHSLQFSGLARELLIDGSFVTSKDEPNDIDLVVVLKADHDWLTPLRPFEYNPVSRRRVKQDYGFDLIVVVEDTADYDRRIDFYQRLRDFPELRKGILRVIIQ